MRDKSSKKFYQKKWFIVLVALFVLGGIGNALSDKNKESKAERRRTAEPTTIAITPSLSTEESTEAQTEESAATTSAETFVYVTETLPQTVENTIAATEPPLPVTAEPPTTAPTAATQVPITLLTSALTFTQNQTATISIQGKPNTEYALAVKYSSSFSKADGLGKQISDANGYVTWQWTIGPKTANGTYNAYISGDAQNLTIPFKVE